MARAAVGCVGDQSLQKQAAWHAARLGRKKSPIIWEIFS